MVDNSLMKVIKDCVEQLPIKKVRIDIFNMSTWQRQILKHQSVNLFFEEQPCIDCKDYN